MGTAVSPPGPPQTPGILTFPRNRNQLGSKRLESVQLVFIVFPAARTPSSISCADCNPDLLRRRSSWSRRRSIRWWLWEALPWSAFSPVHCAPGRNRAQISAPAPLSRVPGESPQTARHRAATKLTASGFSISSECGTAGPRNSTPSGHCKVGKTVGAFCQTPKHRRLRVGYDRHNDKPESGSPSTSTFHVSPRATGCPAVSVPVLMRSPAPNGKAPGCRARAATNSARQSAGLRREFRPLPSSTNSPFFETRTRKDDRVSTSPGIASSSGGPGLSHDQRQVQAEAGHKVGGLELPVRVGTADQLEADRQPVHVLQHGRGVGSRGHRPCETENDLRLDLGRTVVRKRDPGALRAGVVDRVVVHMSPYQRVELEHPPHGFVGIAYFQPGRRAAVAPPQRGILGLDGVGRVQIERGIAGGGRRRDDRAGRVRGQHLARERMRFECGHRRRRSLYFRCRRTSATLAAVSGVQPPFGRNYGRSMVISQQGIAATSHPLASQAGVRILAQGGSAADAAIAANAVLGVVEPMMNGMGGDLFVLYWDNRAGTLSGLNGSGPAPSGLSRGMLSSLRFPSMPAEGIHAVTVPGAVDGWARMHERFGKLDWGALFEPAIACAELGFPVSEIVAELWSAPAALQRMCATPQAARVFLPGGRPPRMGERFRNPELAEAYRLLAAGGAAAFYTGVLAEAILRTSQGMAGAMTANDLSSYAAEWVQPISTDYRGWTVFELPPNGQGMAALEMLNIMEEMPADPAGPSSAGELHRRIEAMKLAYADVYRYNADPRFCPPPVETLLSKRYARERAAAIDPERANANAGAGDASGCDTVYLTVVDRQGNIASWIQSIFSSFGSGIVVDGMGFVLQNRGAGFTLEADHPNALEPGKRPFHTIIPGFLQRGERRAGFGIMGGANQPLAHAQFLSNVIDYGMNLQEAMEAPRFFKAGAIRSRRGDRSPRAGNDAAAPHAKWAIESHCGASIRKRWDADRRSCTMPARHELRRFRSPVRRSGDAGAHRIAQARRILTSILGMSQPTTLLELIQVAPAEATAMILPESGIRVSYQQLRDQVHGDGGCPGFSRRPSRRPCRHRLCPTVCRPS